MPTFNGSNNVRSRLSGCWSSLVRYGKVTIYFTFKLVELMLATTLLALWLNLYACFDGEDKVKRTQLMFISSVFGAFLVISLGLFISLLSGNRHNAVVDSLVSGISGVLYMAAGSVAVHHFNHTSWLEAKDVTKGINMGILAIAQGIIYFFDAAFVFIKAD